MREVKKALSFILTLEFWRMGIFWTLSLAMSYFQLFWQRVCTKKPNAYPRCPPRRIGTKKPICVITGATSGIGAAAAYDLSKEGFSCCSWYSILPPVQKLVAETHIVYAVGRSSQLLSKMIEWIHKQNKDARVEAFEVDLSSFQSILKFKDSLEKWLLDSDMHVSIQLLINNAGMLAASHRLTEEGYDHPVGSRIVNVTSFTHRNLFNVQIDKETVAGKYLPRSKQYPFSHIYEFSKLCLLMFSYELHRQFHWPDESCKVSVIAADPGAVETNIMRELPSCVSHMAFIALKLLGLLQSPEEGASSVIDAALAPPEISGVYFFGGKGRTLNSSALSRNIRLAEKLWRSSDDLFLESKLICDRTYTDTLHELKD
ncbi:hypothetical protein OIU85_002792 [Salix viminalis]|uniref:Uncharacterized protein n=1 Tax=Salix viminalis TaxID=40686 RepID=A0A9Q0VRS1_SALVM|nr:hypothetical protein OIU85_002792 [Salix viminalis]